MEGSRRRLIFLLRGPTERCAIAVPDAENYARSSAQGTVARRGARWRYLLALFSVIATGIALGVMHHIIALQSLWVFRNAEPLSSWTIIVAGPLTTLPAVFLAIFRRSWGATWL